MMMSSLLMAGAIFIRCATAWALSMAQMIHSVRAIYSNAFTASTSVTGTYSALTIS